MTMQAKQKVTVTLPADIVRALDEQARAAGGSRSDALVRVLDAWQSRAVSSNPAAQLEADTAAYYQALSPAERDEDAEWVVLSGHAAVPVWDGQ